MKQLAALVLGSIALLASPVRAQLCAGDCNHDGTIGVNELVIAVNILLGNQPITACDTYPCSTPPDCVRIQDIVRAVNGLLFGCPETPPPDPTPTRTPGPPDPLFSALNGVLTAQCHPVSGVPALLSVEETANGFLVDCKAHVGAHETTVELVRHADMATAAAAFATAAAEGDPIALDDVPAAYWERPFFAGTTGGGRRRFLVWQLDCWVVHVRNFDDTSFQTSPQPLPFSEAILEAAAELMAARCGG